MRGRRAREPRTSYHSPAPVLVDSNVLIDVLYQDPNWIDWSSAQLAGVVDEARGVVNPIVYAEVAANFATIEDLERALAPYDLDREALPWEAAFLAAKAYKLYRKRGGTRSSPLPDFYIGAHASLAGYALLTRDARRYRDYFPRLRLIAPD
ncbi:MAG: type II toxin-antitoxin system VapC family toxin [Burkholderiales bacterium]|nr:type II toxin-antitoxin system VapC family toxin [Burkholderiales bacterium]